jgi:hypothetical protein
MRPFIGFLGVALLFFVLWDAFEAMVLPRRVTRRFRLVRLFYRSSWLVWRALARRLRQPRRRELYLSIYGPLSLLFLFIYWAAALIVAFGMIHWSIGSKLRSGGEHPTFLTDLYMSGSTFTTLGLGDVTPITPAAKFVTVVEAGTGFGFLALVIGYLPVLYQAFSRREVNISLLDARAGSPASAGELLSRHGRSGNMAELAQLLHEWERWAAELMESHLSYPVLSYFRSQHDNQSWLAALTTILDACSLVSAGMEGAPVWQAEMTFAIARHAVVDLAQVLNIPPRQPKQDRLPHADWQRLRASLLASGVPLRSGAEVEARLTELRRMYEPYVNALGSRLLFRLPPWIRPAGAVENWRTSAWGRATGLTAGCPSEHDDHTT